MKLLKKYIFLPIAILSLTSGTVLASPSGNILATDIFISGDCITSWNILEIYSSDVNSIGTLKTLKCSDYFGQQWQNILIIPAIDTRIIEFDSISASGRDDCKNNLTYSQCLANYPTFVVSTNTASFANNFNPARTPFASGFSSGGVATISEFVFTDLFPIAGVAMGLYLGIRLLDWLAHWFMRRKGF